MIPILQGKRREACQEVLKQLYEEGHSEAYRGMCPKCGVTFYARSGQTIYCGHACQVKSSNQRQVERNRAVRSTVIQCGQCGVSFPPIRSDSKYCSPRCKQAAYRERVTGNKSRHVAR